MQRTHNLSPTSGRDAETIIRCGNPSTEDITESRYTISPRILFVDFALAKLGGKPRLTWKPTLMKCWLDTPVTTIHSLEGSC